MPARKFNNNIKVFDGIPKAVFVVFAGTTLGSIVGEVVGSLLGGENGLMEVGWQRSGVIWVLSESLDQSTGLRLEGREQ
eukprot:10788384-Ditylum_brightwellii.AAC.1